MKNKFWKNKKVFLTGHTGFKGSWLSLWLTSLGAEVTGYALAPETEPNLFGLCRIERLVRSRIADIRDRKLLSKTLKSARPEIVIHLAAQPLVRLSYKQPVETFSTNVMGTVNILEAVRQCSSVKAVVNVTTDKVYENKFGVRSLEFREEDRLGGYDPYSSSKACSELVAQAYQRSYGLNVATARAGNVIGGGDWAADRLVPDFIRAMLKGKKLMIRNPRAVRPWQHVLEPLHGYLLLAESLYRHPGKYASAWNFGPEKKDAKPVAYLAKELCALWGEASYSLDTGRHPHESGFLLLDAGKAKKELGWRPKWSLDQALERIVAWHRADQAGEEMRQVCLDQIEDYHDF
jgi:CDP-glucose 4,6-dehydratase